MTVGAFPAVPAGERSCVGMAAIVAAPPALVVGGAVDGGFAPAVVAVVALVEALGEELPHPVRPRAEAATSASIQTRKRDMKDSSEESPHADGWSGKR
jgi:hypothetical protein